ncbi:MAG TPA: GTP-binding protein, partial [Pirellulaceae bacterium]|nr:GTP-binding protein [Pirellulaceae bacterium]
MPENRTILGLSLVIALAGLGALLVYLPPLVIEQYKTVQELGGPTAVTIYFTIVGTGVLFLVGASGWILWSLVANTLRKRRRQIERSRLPSAMSSSERSAEIQENLELVAKLPADETVRAELTPLTEQLVAKQTAQTLEIVAFGTISSGKSSLMNALAGRDIFATDARGGTTVRRNQIPWPGFEKVLLVDTPGLGEIDGAEHVAITASAAKDADLILLVVDGPLRDDEFRLLQQLAAMEKRLLVCLNKSDWYDARSRELLLGQLAEQVQKFVPARDIVAVRSQPVARSRVRVLADGSEVSEATTVPPDIEPLAARMLEVLRRDGRDLLLANLLLQSRGMVEEARQKVRASLDRRAWEIVDLYTWSAGGAAALSPFPLVDLAAGCAISTKMVVDLAQVYGQPMDLKIAMNLLGQLGKNLISILGVHAATPAIASAVG